MLVSIVSRDIARKDEDQRKRCPTKDIFRSYFLRCHDADYHRLIQATSIEHRTRHEDPGLA